MESLFSSNVQPRSATINWKIPSNLALFPPGLEFRVAYQTLASWVDSTVFNVSLVFIWCTGTKRGERKRRRTSALESDDFLCLIFRTFPKPALWNGWIVRWSIHWMSRYHMPTRDTEWASGPDPRLPIKVTNASGLGRPTWYSKHRQTVSFFFLFLCPFTFLFEISLLETDVCFFIWQFLVVARRQH